MPKNESTVRKEKRKIGQFPGNLRQWYAGMALQGMLANAFVAERYPMMAPDLSREAFIYADAMIAEGEKE